MNANDKHAVAQACALNDSNFNLKSTDLQTTVQFDAPFCSKLEEKGRQNRPSSNGQKLDFCTRFIPVCTEKMVYVCQDVLRNLKMLQCFSTTPAIETSTFPFIYSRKKIVVDNAKKMLLWHIGHDCILVLYCVWFYCSGTLEKSDVFQAHQHELVEKCWEVFWSSNYEVPPCLDKFLQGIAHEPIGSGQTEKERRLLNFFVSLTYEVQFKQHYQEQNAGHVMTHLVLQRLCNFMQSCLLQKNTVHAMRSPNPVTYKLCLDLKNIKKSDKTWMHDDDHGIKDFQRTSNDGKQLPNKLIAGSIFILDLLVAFVLRKKQAKPVCNVEEETKVVPSRLGKRKTSFETVFANIYAKNLGIASKGVHSLKCNSRGIEPAFNVFVDLLPNDGGKFDLDLSLQAADYHTFGPRPKNTVYNLILHIKYVFCL